MKTKITINEDLSIRSVVVEDFNYDDNGFIYPECYYVVCEYKGGLYGLTFSVKTLTEQSFTPEECHGPVEYLSEMNQYFATDTDNAETILMSQISMAWDNFKDDSIYDYLREKTV